MALEKNSGNGVDDIEIMSQAYSALVTALTSAASDITTKVLLKFIRDEKLDINLKRRMMPYLYTAGFLSFAARPVTVQTISDTMKAAGLEPQANSLTMLSKTDVKSHVIYAYAFYYLVAIGKEPSEENISKVVKSLNLEVDNSAFQEALAYIKSSEL